MKSSTFLLLIVAIIIIFSSITTTEAKEQQQQRVRAAKRDMFKNLILRSINNKNASTIKTRQQQQQQQQQSKNKKSPRQHAFASKNFEGEFGADPTNCPKTTKTQKLDIPPRYMWGWDDEGKLNGYCGETSFQSTLIYYGSWVSAERVRYADGNAELLIGVNDEKAAQNLQLNYDSWDGWRADGQDFLDNFVKPHIDNDEPVTLGWYIYEPGGDREYDHIMIITGYDFDETAGKNGAVVGLYFNDYHSEYKRHTCAYNTASEKNPLFIASRSTCNSNSGVKHPFKYCVPKTTQYAIALTSLDVTLSGITTKIVNLPWKEPDWGAEDGVHDEPVEQSISLEVTGVDKDAAYTVLRFDTATAMTKGKTPTESSYSWKKHFTASTSNKTETLWWLDTRMSDGEYYYVCVAGTL